MSKSQREREAREFERALDDARKIRETLKTEGWQIIDKILCENIDALDTLKGVTTIKEVMARQLAGSTLMKFRRELIDIVMKVDETEKRVLPSEDSIYRIMKQED